VKLFFHGGGTTTYHRFTTCASDVEHDEGAGGSDFTFTSMPDMTVGPVKFDGTTEDRPLEITFTSNAFFDRLTNGTPHAPVYVRVWEVQDPGEGTETLLLLFRGRLARATRNPGGQGGRCMLEFSSPKARMSVPLGMQANHHCINTFGDDSADTGSPGNQCTINVSPLAATGTVGAISGKTLTLLSVSTPGGRTRYWHKGSVEFNGTRIQIREWVSSAPTLFHLVNFPPADWSGEVVTIWPGCDKGIGTCREWANEGNFNGFGMEIPSRNPVYEKG
jgi:hypothetical protein